MCIAIQEYISLKNYTTFKTGGAARYFISCTTKEQIILAVSFAKKMNLPFFVLGEGSNVLVHDKGFEGVIMHVITKGRRYKNNNEVVLATYAAGEILDEIVEELVKKGYWGLENLSHIPGTVGATPVQNVGAYGVEVSDVIHEVQVYDTRDNEEKILFNKECEFSYRDSLFKSKEKGRYIILSVTFRLTPLYRPVLQYKDLLPLNTNKNISQEEVRQAIISIRSKKFPDWKQVGTAGSYYKNPVISNHQANVLLKKYPSVPIYDVPNSDSKKISLGWVLDKICGLKGYREGDVGTYENQALVLVNYSLSNTTENILNFSDQIKKKVYTKTGICIEEEVTVLF